MAQMGKNWVKCFWVNSDFSPDVSWCFQKRVMFLGSSG
jgi:hypothetical protein